MLFYVPIIVFTIGVTSAFASYGQSVVMRNIGQRIVSDMQIDLFSHLMHSDLAVFHDQASGRLISRFTNDIMLMRNAVSTVLTGIAKDFFSMVFLVALMFHQNAKLALIAFVVFPLAVLPVMQHSSILGILPLSWMRLFMACVWSRPMGARSMKSGVRAVLLNHYIPSILRVRVCRQQHRRLWNF
jgi:ABC-type multidrug transport system fused ATPase/permease subunit